MKIIDIKDLAIQDIKVIRFEKFNDSRGYFTEVYNKNDFRNHCKFLEDVEFQQVNEAFSYANTFRGLHFQWSPYMGKLVRLIYGCLVDFALDLRPNSLTYRKIIAYEVKSTSQYSDWIWLPPGFAHGTWLLEDSLIEYFCSGTYNPECEGTISIFSDDIQWDLSDKNLSNSFKNIDMSVLNIKDRDINGISITDFEKSENSKIFDKF